LFCPVQLLTITTVVVIFMRHIGRPHMPNRLRFVAICSCIFISRPSIASPFFPHSLLYFFSLTFRPPLLFSKEVNKKLSYRGQNALSVIKLHEGNDDSEHILYLSVCHCRLAGRIVFSTCPSVRPFVCPFVALFVCYQLVNAILRKRINRFQCKLA